MMSRHLRNWTVVIVAATALSACVSVLPESEPQSVYRLTAPEPRSWEGDQWAIIAVERPIAPASLAGNAIALEMQDNRLAYMSGARWADVVPRMLQSQIVETMHGVSPSLVPARPEDGVRADAELRMDLRHFEAVYDQGEQQAPLVHVSMAARLIAVDTRDFIGARVFSTTVRARDNRAGAIVDAFDSATSEVTTDMARWMNELAADRRGDR